MSRFLVSTSSRAVRALPSAAVLPARALSTSSPLLSYNIYPQILPALLPTRTPHSPPLDPSTAPKSFLLPPRLPPTHRIPACTLHVRAFSPTALDFFVDFAQRAAYHLGIPCGNPARLPTRVERFAVLKSPFVHKKAQEIFERKTHKRALKTWDADPQAVQRWLDYLQQHAMGGVGMRAEVWEYEEIGLGKRMMARAEEGLRGGGAGVGVADTAASAEAEVRRLAEEIVKVEMERLQGKGDAPEEVKEVKGKEGKKDKVKE